MGHESVLPNTKDEGRTPGSVHGAIAQRGWGRSLLILGSLHGAIAIRTWKEEG